MQKFLHELDRQPGAPLLIPDSTVASFIRRA
jgi:hypothetical protein